MPAMSVTLRCLLLLTLAARSFAKDKPITLLNGANLLHLLQKHGHRAKIDIQEARRAR